MKLRKGLKVTVGHKTWVDEIPDDKFAIMSKDWSEQHVEDFIKRHCDKPKKADK